MHAIKIPNKLIEEGAAILQVLNKNHHNAILGIQFMKPLLINSAIQHLLYLVMKTDEA